MNNLVHLAQFGLRDAGFSAVVVWSERVLWGGW